MQLHSFLKFHNGDSWIQQGSVACNTARMINIFKEFMERESLQRDYSQPDLKYCDSLVSLKNGFIVPQPKKHTVESVWKCYLTEVWCKFRQVSQNIVERTDASMLDSEKYLQHILCSVEYCVKYTNWVWV